MLARVPNAIVMRPPRAGEHGTVRILVMRSLVLAVGVVGLMVWFGLMPVASQSSPPQQITSDTPAYCLQLLDRVSGMVRSAGTPPPQEVGYLSSEGRRMCDQGQTRGGILRLRRALMLMMHQSGGP
jgi:hypothetical protein